jgi:hypothetical protein
VQLKKRWEMLPRRRRRRRRRERVLNGNSLNKGDIHVLLEELQTEGDDDEVALLPKSREELEAELK